MDELKSIFQHANPILNYTSNAMVILDHEGEIISWNHQSEELFGYSAEQMVGLNIHIPPHHSEQLTELFNASLRSHKEQISENLTLETQNNKLIQLTAFAKAVTIKDERFVMIRFTATHKSEKNAASELNCLRNGLEESFMVLELDHEGLINFANPLYLKYSKWTPKRILGKTLWQMFPQTEQGINKVNEIWNIVHGGHIWQGEVEKAAKDGTSYWVELIAIPVSSNNSSPDYFLILATDITEKNYYNNVLKKSPTLTKKQV
ncbi:PAS domain-containing protein [Kurthia senegalensis]|uniref:PAS domain-containing protein n=1 Tax=Kurthia senegalensis TaxID=1033740 RepID=UPI0002890B7B|nr:PAS domain-containing protein [Kurthia senegalensis]